MERSRLLVTVEAEGINPCIQGGNGGADLYEVRDCVIACFTFGAEGIDFDVEASEVITASA